MLFDGEANPRQTDTEQADDQDRSEYAASVEIL
jgi:hypothetical protein